MTEICLNDEIVVFGYIHQYEELNNVYIPVPIIHVLHSFYHVLIYVHEYFDKYSTTRIQISQDKRTITRIGSPTYCTTYCKNWIDSHNNSSIHKIKIKINNSN
eukprot:80763_1